MSGTHILIAACLGSFWAGIAALAMRLNLLPIMPGLIVGVGAVSFALCLLVFSLCIVQHDYN